jgi:hypothetical protein
MNIAELGPMRIGPMRAVRQLVALAATAYMNVRLRRWTTFRAEGRT